MVSSINGITSYYKLFGSLRFSLDRLGIFVALLLLSAGQVHFIELLQLLAVLHFSAYVEVRASTLMFYLPIYTWGLRPYPRAFAIQIPSGLISPAFFGCSVFFFFGGTPFGR